MALPGIVFAQSVEPESQLLEGSYLRTQSTAAHCGVYSLAAALRAIDVEPRINELLDEAYISSPRGSTAEDLILGARIHDVSVQAYQNGSIQWLRGLDHPALLLLNNTRQAEGTRHWITFLGFQDGSSFRRPARRSQKSTI